MKILRNIKDLKKAINKIKNIGFVPTMGGFHKGHISLIKDSIKKSNKTLVSIYVNPTQFNNHNDFKKYPRNVNRDLKLLKKLKVNFVFLPKTSEIYKKRAKKINLHTRDQILCAKFRKGHFEGVIDIMDRLLNIIKPSFVFMGEKDFQQLYLIKKYLLKKYKTKIYSCKTVRDNFQVALSTRNFLLSKKDLNQARYIAKKLKRFKKQLIKNSNVIKEFDKFKNTLIKIVKSQFNIKIEYLEVKSEKNLTKYKKNKKFRILIAYYINNIRLIDNF